MLKSDKRLKQVQKIKQKEEDPSRKWNWGMGEVCSVESGILDPLAYGAGRPLADGDGLMQGKHGPRRQGPF